MPILGAYQIRHAEMVTVIATPIPRKESVFLFGLNNRIGYNLTMSLFWIKIGKALSAIQEEGIFRSSGRIMSGVWSLIRPIGKGDVLLISGGVGDSWHKIVG